MINWRRQKEETSILYVLFYKIKEEKECRPFCDFETKCYSQKLLKIYKIPVAYKKNVYKK